MLFTLLMPFEMLLCNLFVIDRCSRRKYSRLHTFFVMGIFVLLLMFFSYLVSSQVPDFGRGNGLFVFCGFLFIIPVKLLYHVDAVKIIAIACTSWVYTFLLFALSVRLGSYFPLPGTSLRLSSLLYQSLLYLLTFYAFYRALKTKFIFVLENVTPKEALALMWVSIIWFWTVFVFNLSFVYPHIGLFQVLSLATLAACAVSGYRYIYLHIHSDKTVHSLEKIAYTDELTQLRSRVVLQRDMDSLTKRGIPFHLIFFDLNDFKTINDRFGHLAGDEYLAFFAKEIKLRLGNRGGFYRVAGDEFVAVLTDAVLEEFLKDVATLPKTLPGSGIEYLGVSYGVAHYPEDGTTGQALLEEADRRMYVMKAKKPKRR